MDKCEIDLFSQGAEGVGQNVMHSDSFSHQAFDLGEDRALLIGAVKRPAPDNLPTDKPGINQLSYLALNRSESYIGAAG
jgi:hypothetical protein